MKQLIIFLTIITLNTTLFSSSANTADCLILHDENSIVCKYTHLRKDSDTNITVQWIEPTGEMTREKFLVIPATHGSVYDYRYIKGRTKGEWTFKVIDNNKEYTTNFIIE